MAEETGATTAEASVARGTALVFAAALGATLLMAAPVILAPSEHLFGSLASLGREDPNRDALVVIDQFRAGRVATPYLQPLTDLPGRALARLVGPVAAYNVLTLATFPLSAAAAYLLARYVLGSHLAAMVAGLAYAFLPFHVAHAAAHPHVAQTQWLPLYFLALWRCLDRPDLRRVLFLLAAAAAVALSNFYAGLIAAVLSPVALVAYWLVSPRRPRERTLRSVAITSLALAAAGAAGLVLIHCLSPAVLLHPNAFAFPRSDLFLHGAKWWSYLVPAVDHPLAASRVREFWAARGVEEALLEQQVGLGWSIVALGAVPLWLWLRGDRASLAVRSAPVLASVAVAALLCSLSPERTIGSFTFVRPSALLYAVAPMFRAHARFGVVVGLMSALLAGAGAARLWRWPTSAGRRAAALLLGLAVVEYSPLPPWRWRDVLPTRAHRWLAAQSASLRVLDCVPPSRWSDSLALPLARPRGFAAGTADLRRLWRAAARGQALGDGLYARRGTAGQRDGEVAGGPPGARRTCPRTGVRGRRDPRGEGGTAPCVRARVDRLLPSRIRGGGHLALDGSDGRSADCRDTRARRQPAGTGTEGISSRPTRRVVRQRASPR